jgi:hypothetical protein
MNTLINSNPSLLLILMLWTLPWKIYSLWVASKKNHRAWFIALIILNTFGILEIIYIFGIAKKTFSDMKKTLTSLFTPKK